MNDFFRLAANLKLLLFSHNNHRFTCATDIFSRTSSTSLFVSSDFTVHTSPAYPLLPLLAGYYCFFYCFPQFSLRVTTVDALITLNHLQRHTNYMFMYGSRMEQPQNNTNDEP